MGYRTGLAIAALGLSFLAGCASDKMPTDFLLPENRLTAEQGMRLIAEGDRIAAGAEEKISEGRRLVKEGRRERQRGEELMTKGRQALRAAKMLEEAEELRQKGRELQNEALTPP